MTDYAGPSAEDPVDFWLSVKWSNKYLGASKPDGVGDTYQWGYTKSNKMYYCKQGKATKYCTKDEKTTLEASDDAAYDELGTGWRMPSVDEVIELLSNSSVIYGEYEGCEGFIVKCNKKGYEQKSLFFIKQKSTMTLYNQNSPNGWRTYNDVTFWTASKPEYGDEGAFGYTHQKSSEQLYKIPFSCERSLPIRPVRTY